MNEKIGPNWSEEYFRKIKRKELLRKALIGAGLIAFAGILIYSFSLNNFHKKGNSLHDLQTISANITPIYYPTSEVTVYFANDENALTSESVHTNALEPTATPIATLEIIDLRTDGQSTTEICNVLPNSAPQNTLENNSAQEIEDTRIYLNNDNTEPITLDPETTEMYGDEPSDSTFNIFILTSGINNWDNLNPEEYISALKSTFEGVENVSFTFLETRELELGMYYNPNDEIDIGFDQNQMNQLRQQLRDNYSIPDGIIILTDEIPYTLALAFPNDGTALVPRQSFINANINQVYLTVHEAGHLLFLKDNYRNRYTISTNGFEELMYSEQFVFSNYVNNEHNRDKREALLATNPNLYYYGEICAGLPIYRTVVNGEFNLMDNDHRPAQLSKYELFYINLKINALLQEAGRLPPNHR